jgi:hypothetical protein
MSLDVVCASTRRRKLGTPRMKRRELSVPAAMELSSALRENSPHAKREVPGRIGSPKPQDTKRGLAQLVSSQLIAPRLGITKANRRPVRNRTAYEIVRFRARCGPRGAGQVRKIQGRVFRTPD